MKWNDRVTVFVDNMPEVSMAVAEKGFFPLQQGDKSQVANQYT